MLPYDILRRCESYLQSAEHRPVIRQCIQEALHEVCASNQPGKDWSFLKHQFEIDSPTPVSASALQIVFEAPSSLRALTEVVSLGGVPFASLIAAPYNYVIEWNGRQVSFSRTATDTPFPSVSGKYTVAVNGYRAHPCILVPDASHPSPTWDSDWYPAHDESGTQVPAWPPASAILLPEEAYSLLVDSVLIRLKSHEIEVAFSVQDLEQKVEKGLAQLRANYALQIYPVNPPATPTVEWLVAVGTSRVGSERFQNQLLAFVNEIAGDFADAVKLQLSRRPSTILSVSSAALPDIGGLQVPAQYWSAGMEVKAGMLSGEVTEQSYAKYEQAKREWAEQYYAINVQRPSGISLDNFGGLVEFIKSEWKSCRNDMQAWTIANDCVADVMNRVNTDELMKQGAPITLSHSSQSYDLPSDMKCIVKVEIDGEEIAGRSFTARGPVTPSMTKYQHLCSGQAFRLAGKRLVLELAPQDGQKMVLYYYQKHMWTTWEASPVLVDSMLVSKAVQARIAVEEGNAQKASYFQAEYEKAIQQYNMNQWRNYPADDRIINATPSVTRNILKAFD